jgi:thioesterase domain-containing protein
MVDYPGCAGCKIHNGFNTGFNLIKNAVNSQIQNLRALHRNAPIYITGHSLGGAIAVVSAP